MTLILIDKSMQKKKKIQTLKKLKVAINGPFIALLKKNKKKSYGYEYDIKIII